MLVTQRQAHSHLPTHPHEFSPIASSSPSPPTRFFAPRPRKATTTSKHPNQVAPSSSSKPSPPRPPSRTERLFACTYDGCDKAYFKPSRLAEHELTHTGERPHKCPNCEQTYLRASHLHAHLRTHLPDDARGFACPREGCEKRFWTATHLKRHEGMHDEVQVYPCEHCPETFAKSHHLRAHVTLAHLPPGSKPYPCSHEGCTWSFALKQHLRAHGKTHDPTRYTCSHPSHGDDLPSFPVWSALQTHLHNDHPPSCPHEECGGRVFKSAQRLKEHLKVHAQGEADLEKRFSQGQRFGSDLGLDGLSRREKKRRRIETVEGGRSPKLARLVDGEAGKEYECDDEGCGKRFKTRFALKAHRQTSHLGIKIHVCVHEGCDKSYAHKSNLDRHIASHEQPAALQELDLGRKVTGEASVERRYACPEGCEGRFWRVYDVRRHLTVDHGLELDDDQVRRFIARSSRKVGV